MATPVHCWHHHLYETQNVRQTDETTANGSALSLFSGNSLANHCDICAHHYAVYEPASSWQYSHTARLQQVTYAVYQAIAPTATIHQYSNKGPPAGPIA